MYDESDEIYYIYIFLLKYIWFFMNEKLTPPPPLSLSKRDYIYIYIYIGTYNLIVQ